MIELGKYQELIVSRIRGSGFYLKEANSDIDFEILLPGFQVPKSTTIGDLINVFIYRDSKDELIATTKNPKISLNKLALLKVVKATEIGAFLDWGLDRDLFLPHSEQLYPVEEGDNVLVRMYIDKSERLASTMKIQKGIISQSPYVIDETHQATIYRINPDIGIFVAVEDQYDGLILKQEILGKYNVGDTLLLRTAQIREDGKLIMSFKKRANLQKEDDAELILKKLADNNDFLPYNDDSSPEEINKFFSLSKRAFKRAIGKLLKDGQIEILSNGIKVIEARDNQ